MGTIDFHRIECILMPDEHDPVTFTGLNKGHLSMQVLSYIDECDADYYNMIIRGFDKDENETILMDFGEKIQPISKTNLMHIMESYGSVFEQVNNVIFDTSVTKCGNSLVLKITEQCRLMGLEPGDNIRVKMERINTFESKDNIEKLFYRKRTKKIDPYVMYADGEEGLKYFNKFVEDYGIVGQVSLSGVFFDIRDMIMDHYNAVRTKEGHVILISIPYNNEGKEEYAKAFAEAHNLNYDYINEYSWYHRGDTQLVIFWLKDITLNVNRQ